MSKSYPINSVASLSAFKANVDKLWHEHKYITFSAPRIGRDRSIDQNALFHVWATEYVAYRMKKDRRLVDPGELAGMKEIIKSRYVAYDQSSYSWMVHDVVNPFNGASKKGYTSSAKWKRQEMFQVLSWFQMVAAEDGLPLESKGQFAKLQRENAGV